MTCRQPQSLIENNLLVLVSQNKDPILHVVFFKDSLDVKLKEDILCLSKGIHEEVFVKTELQMVK